MNSQMHLPSLDSAISNINPGSPNPPKFIRDNMYIDDIEGVRSKRIMRGQNLSPEIEKSKNEKGIKPKIAQLNLGHFQNKILK